MHTVEITNENLKILYVDAFINHVMSQAFIETLEVGPLDEQIAPISNKITLSFIQPHKNITKIILNDYGKLPKKRKITIFIKESQQQPNQKEKNKKLQYNIIDEPTVLSKKLQEQYGEKFQYKKYGKTQPIPTEKTFTANQIYIRLTPTQKPILLNDKDYFIQITPYNLEIIHAKTHINHRKENTKTDSIDKQLKQINNTIQPTFTIPNRNIISLKLEENRKLTIITTETVIKKSLFSKQLKKKKQKKQYKFVIVEEATSLAKKLHQTYHNKFTFHKK